jgi:hypothetical protein
MSATFSLTLRSSRWCTGLHRQHQTAQVRGVRRARVVAERQTVQWRRLYLLVDECRAGGHQEQIPNRRVVQTSIAQFRQIHDDGVVDASHIALIDRNADQG